MTYRFVLLIFIAFATAFVGPLKSEASVWTTTRDWNDAAEQEYRQWVIANWNKNIFVTAGPLQGIKVDCADAVYSMRVMFSAAAGLPYAMKDTTARGAPMISNEMTRWDSKPPEVRLRSFLIFVHAIGATETLPLDTYPTAINPQTLGAGSVIITDQGSHHSWTIQSWSNVGIPYLLFGSRPERSLLWDRNEIPSVGFIFKNGFGAQGHAGFRNFRQPADVGKPVQNVPGFSLEQYAIPEGTWRQEIQRRMQVTSETGEQRLVRTMGQACKGARERVGIVNDALKLNDAIGSRCMTGPEYDDQSTPNRDARLQDSFRDMASAFALATKNGTISSNSAAQVASVLRGSASVGNTQPACPVEIAPGRTLTLGQIYQLTMAGKLSNNPQDTLEMRWGLDSGHSAKASSCPVY